MAREDAEYELWRSRGGTHEQKNTEEWPRLRSHEGKGRTQRFPTRLKYEGAKAHAHRMWNDLEERLARRQLRQPEVSPNIEERHKEQERSAADEVNKRLGPWNRAPERQINVSTLRGKQDA